MFAQIATMFPMTSGYDVGRNVIAPFGHGNEMVLRQFWLKQAPLLTTVGAAAMPIIKAVIPICDSKIGAQIFNPRSPLLTVYCSFLSIIDRIDMMPCTHALRIFVYITLTSFALFLGILFVVIFSCLSFFVRIVFLPKSRTLFDFIGIVSVVRFISIFVVNKISVGTNSVEMKCFGSINFITFLAPIIQPHELVLTSIKVSPVSRFIYFAGGASFDRSRLINHIDILAQRAKTCF